MIILIERSKMPLLDFKRILSISNFALYISMEIKEIINLEAVDKNLASGNYEGHCVGIDSDFTYILAAEKVCFLKDENFKWSAIVEKIDNENKKVFVSQTNWLFMQHVIKTLYADVKIVKRYPGRLTLVTIRDSLQEINISKKDIKKLGEIVGEKIVLIGAETISAPMNFKKSNEEIKMPGPDTVSAPSEGVNSKGLSEEEEEEKLLNKLVNHLVNLPAGRVVKNKVQIFLFENGEIKFVRVSDVNHQETYFEKTYVNSSEKIQVLREAGAVFLKIISQDKSL